MSEIHDALHRLRSLPDRELETLCRRHHVRVLTVFGSALRDRVADPGDLDLGVMFEPGAPHDVLSLLEDLIAALGTEHLDLLDAQRASETARMRAIGEGEPIFESEPGAYAVARAAAMTLYWDTEHLRRAALEHLSR